ncbi:hypothetical protein RYZ26_08310 [Terasakiella sp. A23]|uniref:hypothetical protein n=1 Tax=Terasakiella sp. FCG-A23 TaxID=3080561 RepID=UPI002954221D|nr:hypothetical protein [Terasakiella sp. A23]MDV7339592.1 hypothetical protein [Terasakiella sp. A23]
MMIDKGAELFYLLLVLSSILLLGGFWKRFQSSADNLFDKSRWQRITPLVIKIAQIALIKFSKFPHFTYTVTPRDLMATPFGETMIIKNICRVALFLFLIYGCYTAMILFFTRAVDPSLISSGKLVPLEFLQDWKERVFFSSILISINVVTDTISLAFTLSNFSYARSHFLRKNNLNAAGRIVWDGIIATTCFIGSQLVSNSLYPMSVHGVEGPNFDTIFSLETVFKPYAIVKNVTDHGIEFFDFTVCGQLFLTGTVFMPTILLFLIVLILLIINVIAKCIMFLSANFSNCNDADRKAERAMILPDQLAGREWRKDNHEAKRIVMCKKRAAKVSGTFALQFFSALSVLLVYDLFFKS